MVEILSKEKIMTSNFKLILIALIVYILLVVIIGGIVLNNEIKYFPYFLLFEAIGGFVLVIFVIFCPKIESKRYRYTVKPSKEIVEFYEKYNVLGTDGDIFVVTYKENQNDK